MQWIDGSTIDIKQYTGEQLCEKLALEQWGYQPEEWLNWPDFIRVACFLIAFDTELTMQGIFTFLENSIGQYSGQIIQAFRAIGDYSDANCLETICQCAPPGRIREEFLSVELPEYNISSFSSNHELEEDCTKRIGELSRELYLYTGFDLWGLLFSYLDRQISLL